MTAPATADEREKLLKVAQQWVDYDLSAMTGSWLDAQKMACALLSSPSVESVRREALEEAARVANAHREKGPYYGNDLRVWRKACAQIEDVIRALPALPGEDKQARG